MKTTLLPILLTTGFILHGTTWTHGSQIMNPPSNANVKTDETKTTATVVAAFDETSAVNSTEILVLLPCPFYSHTNNYMPIFKELARRGHHITMVSPFPQKEELPNWTDIEVENIFQKILSNVDNKDFSRGNGLISKMIGKFFLSQAVVPEFLKMDPLHKLYRDDSKKFDLIFIEPQFVQEPLLAFGNKFGAPVIALFPSYIVPEVAYYTGNPVFTSSYVPNMVFPYSKQMNFIERATNTAIGIVKLLTYNLIYIPKMDKMMRQYFDAPNMPYLGDLLFNVSFTLLDSNPILSYPYPRANNIREFLGINAKNEGKLTTELQSIVDNAKKGVLYFTLGSHYQTSTLRPHVLSSLLEAFSRLPQTILMKWDRETPPENMPSNVHVAQWFPQRAILEHKNCKAFLTHTGAHGLVEAVTNAIPIIAMPLFADQHFYAKWAEEAGIGSVIDIETVTTEEAFTAMSTVINNARYKEKSVMYSKLLKDLPQPTLDEVVYWIEHVIRTKGAHHLRPGSLNLAWYERFGLDVLGTFLTTTLLILWALTALFKYIYYKCCGMSRRKKDKLQ